MIRKVTLCSLVIVIAATSSMVMGQNRPGRQGRSGNVSANAIENDPLSRSAAEKKILAVLNEMGKDRNRRYLSVSQSDGRLFRQLTETAGAKNVVEVGTSTGYSGLWFALALKATDGKLTTFEIDPGRARTAKENFRKAGVDDIITVILGDAHEEVTKIKGTIDILFLDADKEGYIDYLNKLMPQIRPGGMILAHNMRMPNPDPKYIEAITKNPQLDTSFLLMDGAGVGVTLKKHNVIQFEGKQWITDLAKEAAVEQFKGKTALHIKGAEQTYVYLPDVAFQNGTIEVDIAGRMFSGIGFRGRENGRRLEKVYFRPFNAGTEKHKNSVQYAVTGRSDGTWRYLRNNFPGKYETGANIKVFEWFHVKLDIKDLEVKVYVNDDLKPVLVVDRMLDGISKGTLGLWGWDTYFVNFKFTPAD